MQTSTILVAEIHAGRVAECVVAERSPASGRPPQYRRNDFPENWLASVDDESSRAAQSATVPATESLATLHFDPTIRASIFFSRGTAQDDRVPAIRAILPCDVGTQLGP